MVEELSAINESQDKVEFLRRLEREFQGDNERVVDLGEYRSLSKCVCDFGSGNDVGFADGFQGVYSVRVTFPRCSGSAGHPFGTHK